VVPAHDLVDFIQKDDAVLFHLAPGIVHHLIHVDEALGLLLQKEFPGFGDLDPALLGAGREKAPEHFFEIEFHFLHAAAGENFHHGGHLLGDLQIQEALFQAAFPEHGAELFPGGAGFLFRLLAAGGEQEVKEALFHHFFGFGLDQFPLFSPHHGHGQLRQVPHHGLHIPAHVAHFGELGGLDFEKRRLGQLGQPPGDFGFAHPGGADHDDVFGSDFVPEVLRDLLAPPAVPEGNGHGFLGILLADDEFVQLRHDLFGSEMVPRTGEQFTFQHARIL